MSTAMQVSATNPVFAGEVAQRVEMDMPSSGRNWKQIALKSFVALGVVGVSVGVGFVAGQASSGSTTSSSSETEAQSAVSQAQATLKSAYLDASNLAFTSNLTMSQINELIDGYEAAADEWDDQFMTAEIMEALKTLRDDDEGGSRSLRETDESFLRYRDLALTSTQSTIGSVAWAEIESADYSDAIVYKNDAVTVFRKTDAIYGSTGGTTGYACWVIAQESGDIADWIDNFDLGDEDIMSISDYYFRSESCGCEKYTWWWCSRYKACWQSKPYSNGFDGFVKPHNNMRYDIYTRVQSTCNSNDRLIIAGYSRGAGVVSTLAYVYFKDGLWDTSKMLMVTFGSPRVLSDDRSDEIHGQFTQLRFVHDDDLVPSLPYGWMGYKHFGTNKNSNGNEGRDKPGFSTSISDHTSYDEWF